MANKFKIKKTTIVYIIMLVMLLAVVIKCAWVMDDAYISFRYAKNLVEGNGLTWNTGERVQAFSNPLYLFTVIPLYALTKNIYLSSILLSVALTMGAVWIGIRPRSKNDVYLAMIGIAILCVSKSFVDFATSGLENPMTYFIIALFYTRFFKDEKPYSSKSFLKLCLIASLILINRMDSILLFLPALGYSFFRSFKWKKIGYGFLGFAPFVVWEVFSLIYYGFLFPNTAYAKLNLATNKLLMFKYGYDYILSTVSFGDIISIVAIIAALVIGIVYIKSAQGKYFVTATGVLLYMAYIVYIGGDFMVGRFIAAPLFLSVLLIYKWGTNTFSQINSKKLIYVLVAVIVLVGSMTKSSPITSKVKYETVEEHTGNLPNVSDARKFYYNDAGLLYYTMNSMLYGYDANRTVFRWGHDGSMLDEETVYIGSGVGFQGFFCPSDTKIIDKFALCDALLARIPAPPNQRIAHYERAIPAGYMQTYETGENMIEDENLSQYYDKLSVIISGKIFSKERLMTIVNMNLGKYDYLMDKYVESAEYQNSVTEIGGKLDRLVADN